MVTTVQNNPYLKRDANGNVLQDSSDDMAFRGAYTGTNLIYKGLARPGAVTSAAVWQISKQTYDGSNNLTAVEWPQDANAHASSEYAFIWDNRAALTYS